MRWYNTLVSSPVSESGFVQVQVPYFVTTAVLAVAAAWFPRKETGFLLMIWLSFVMFANTVFHITATLILGRYCPGLLTALTLYVPFFYWYIRHLRTRMAVGAVSIGVFCTLSTGVVYVQWHKLLLGS